MIRWVCSLVQVMWQGTWSCSMPGEKKENFWGTSSPCWGVVWEKSMVSRSSRGGVPVLSRPTSKPSSRRFSVKPVAGNSPARPAGNVVRPIWISPLRKVPEHRTTDRAAIRSPNSVSTPDTLLPFTSIFFTIPCLRARPGRSSSVRRIRALYSCLSAWARWPRTAGPLDMLRTRNWMPVESMQRAIWPPRASISRTRWPLASPPMAGLQDIWAIWSMLRVSSRARRPMRAAARAASQPACPPPMTMIS